MAKTEVDLELQESRAISSTDLINFAKLWTATRMIVLIKSGVSPEDAFNTVTDGIVMRRTCTNCRHRKTKYYLKPCCECTNELEKWEYKEWK